MWHLDIAWKMQEPVLKSAQGASHAQGLGFLSDQAIRQPE